MVLEPMALDLGHRGQKRLVNALTRATVKFKALMVVCRGCRAERSPDLNVKSHLYLSILNTEHVQLGPKETVIDGNDSFRRGQMLQAQISSFLKSKGNYSLVVTGGEEPKVMETMSRLSLSYLNNVKDSRWGAWGRSLEGKLGEELTIELESFESLSL
eukprot:Gb_20522 [translate_table: standard]